MLFHSIWGYLTRTCSTCYITCYIQAIDDPWVLTGHMLFHSNCQYLIRTYSTCCITCHIQAIDVPGAYSRVPVGTNGYPQALERCSRMLTGTREHSRATLECSRVPASARESCFFCLCAVITCFSIATGNI